MSDFTNKFGFVGGEMFIPLRKIGSGGNGVVYLCQSVDTEEKFAVKVEKVKDGNTLKNESSVLKEISGVYGIPKFKWFLSTQYNNILVMELLGESLHSIQKQFEDWKLPLKFVVDVGLQCVKILEAFHSTGYIHGDIKPSNLVYGYSLVDCNKLYMIDFGCASKFESKPGSHKSPLVVEKIIGTPLFASTTTHEFIMQSRRDDLISLGYTLIYLYTGRLPWMEYCMTLSPANLEMTYKLKKGFIASFPKDVPKPLRKFMIYASLLFYSETPKYKYLRDVIRSLLDESS